MTRPYPKTPLHALPRYLHCFDTHPFTLEALLFTLSSSLFAQTYSVARIARPIGITTSAGPGNTIIARPVSSTVKPITAIISLFAGLTHQLQNSLCIYDSRKLSGWKSSASNTLSNGPIAHSINHHIGLRPFLIAIMLPTIPAMITSKTYLNNGILYLFMIICL
jgi:hypothetical protein